MEQADIESLAVEPDLEVDGGNQGTLGGLVEVTRRFSGILKSGNRGKFPGERRWRYAGAGRMRLASGGICGPGMPRRAPMKS